ncbi:4'-phosphopantetheinyl transferase family protein [Laedolimicola sp.]|uniref:4'-phosphopantetheinyl transferase family protein n=1 Tax=Laedolimicola sp. TaxID=2981663 RepID=UPI003F803494
MVKIRLARTGEGQDPSEAARELLVSALENEYGIPAAEVRIEKDEKGKPYLEGYSDLYISISHSGPYIACAFGDKPVGVDTEMWKAHPKWRRIVDKMHLREREAFDRACGGAASEEAEEPVEAFCDLWVRKESFLKAIGEGLRIPLYAFDTTEERVRQELRKEPYFIRNYRVEKEPVSIAVCAGEEKLPLDLSMWFW